MEIKRVKVGIWGWGGWVPSGGHGELKAKGAACMILPKTSMEVRMARTRDSWVEW